MARINRFSRRTPYEGSLYEYPVEMLASTMDIAQQRYDQNREIANTIQDFVIPSLAPDRELANKLQTEYAGQVDAIVNEYSGDYSKASRKLQDLTRKIKKDFNPGGVASAISGNYNNYMDWLKNSKELVEKGKVLGEDLNLANSYYLENYKGIGDFDPIKGSYNMFNPDTLTEYVNPDSIIQDVYKNFKPEKVKIGRTVFRNGLQEYIEEESEGISEERLYPSFLTALATDPKYSNYIKQRAKFSGQELGDVTKHIDAYTKQRARDLSYINKSSIQKAERDPLYLLREKNRLDKETFSELMTPFQYDATLESPVAKEANLPEDWQSLFNTGFTNSFKSGTVNNKIGAGAVIVDRKVNNAYKGKNLLDVFNTPEFIAKTNINKDLSQAVWRDLANKDKDAYIANYGKNAAWTAEFDKRFIRTYKGTEANFSRQQPLSIDVVDENAREYVLNKIAGQLRNPESVNVSLVGTNVEKTAKAAGLSSADLMDEKTGKLRPNSVSIVVGGPGYSNVGYKVHTDKGTFVFIDNNVRNSSYGREIKGGLNALFFDDINVAPSEIRRVNPRTGQIELGRLTKKVNHYGGGQYGEDLFFLPRVGLDGNPVDPTPQQTSTYEILSQYAPQIQGMLGTGSTTANQTLKAFEYILGRS